MLDEFDEYAIGNTKTATDAGYFEDGSSQRSNTSWLGSMISSKEESGLLDDEIEGQSLMGNRQTQANTSEESGIMSYIPSINTSFFEDNKYVKSLKGYSNWKIAVVLWMLGLVMLFFAMCELPFIAIFPKSFIRNLSLGSTLIYSGMAFYMGPYEYFISIFGSQTIVLTLGSYLVCTCIAFYCVIFGVGYFSAIFLSVVQIGSMVWLLIKLFPVFTSGATGKMNEAIVKTGAQFMYEKAKETLV
ncbi:unnamed protein product [Moneuplotes crassus]|uniref:Vesicle transport protein n=1 Tax=Euplotes crassus TaxID=5936 RepID=A0AAD2D511_EUPCR|nr:unnamed protein product [Moneuplotes crassus]